MLFLLKRYSHLHYRLEIGLCFAFGLTNLCDFMLTFVGWTNIPTDEPTYTTDKVGLHFHIFTLSATIHYLIVMYLNYLLKSLGRNEESLHAKEKWMHIFAWVMGIPYILTFWFVKDEIIITIILIVTFSLHLSFIFICTGSVIIQQRRIFNINSEVLSPLITTSTKTTLTGFLARIVFMTVLAFLIYLQAFLFSSHLMLRYLRNNHVIHYMPLVSLDGLLISILLATTPQLIKAYKKKYYEWFQNDYDVILPPSPYIKEPSSNPKSTSVTISI